LQENTGKPPAQDPSFRLFVIEVESEGSAFPSDMALLKLIYLAYIHHIPTSRKSGRILQNWNITVSQLAIWFEGTNESINLKQSADVRFFLMLKYG
jgi:hypothetical protein